MSETLTREYERKYDVTNNRAILDQFRGLPRTTIEQFYVNRINEPFELRFRRESDDFGATFDSHSATLKSHGLPDRLEISADIDPDIYATYLDHAHGSISKTRQTLPQTLGGWALDFFGGRALYLLEVEGETATQPDEAFEVTDNIAYTNGMMAREGHPQELKNNGKLSHFDAVQGVRDFVTQQRHRKQPAVVHIAGATASGKTTVARQLSQDLGGTLLSMDAYYKGKTRMRSEHGIEVPNWDEPLSYDIDRLAADIANFRQGRSIRVPRYSFAESEPLPETHVIDPSQTDLLVIEGLYALLADLRRGPHCAVYVDAPLATRIGRRIVRDVSEGRAFSPSDNLRYCLEVAEPTYDAHGADQRFTANHVINM